MTVSMSFINMKRSEALERYALLKIQPKVEKMSPAPVAVEISFIHDHGDEIVKLNLRGRHNTKMVLKQKAECMGESVELLARRLKNLLARKKGRQRASFRKLALIEES